MSIFFIHLPYFKNGTHSGDKITLTVIAVLPLIVYAALK